MMNYYPLLLSSFRPSPSVSSGGDKIPLEEELVGGEPPPPPGNRISGTAAAAGLPSSKDDQSVASESSGFGSLPKKRSGTTATTGEVVIGLGLVDDRVTDCDPMVETGGGGGGGVVDAVAQSGVSPTNPMLSSTDHGHSRNSSNTSQVSDIKVTGVEVEV